MSILDLDCNDSLFFSKECILNNPKKNCLILGHEHQRDLSIYMNFRLPPSLYKKSLINASLVLFKLTNDHCYEKKSGYTIYPLLDYFNYYYCKFTPPSVSKQYKINFHIKECEGYTEIDITNIVKAWLNEVIHNHGILITGDSCASPIKYASNRNDITCMHPILRLNYEENSILPHLTCAPCNVELN